jgi:hypothetical protein
LPAELAQGCGRMAFDGTIARHRMRLLVLLWTGLCERHSASRGVLAHAGLMQPICAATMTTSPLFQRNGTGRIRLLASAYCHFIGLGSSLCDLM